LLNQKRSLGDIELHERLLLIVDALEVPHLVPCPLDGVSPLLLELPLVVADRGRLLHTVGESHLLDRADVVLVLLHYLLLDLVGLGLPAKSDQGLMLLGRWWVVLLLSGQVPVQGGCRSGLARLLRWIDQLIVGVHVLAKTWVVFGLVEVKWLWSRKLRLRLVAFKLLREFSVESLEVRDLLRDWWLETEGLSLLLFHLLLSLLCSLLLVQLHTWWQLGKRKGNLSSLLDTFFPLLLSILNHRIVKWDQNSPWNFTSSEGLKLPHIFRQLSDLQLFLHCKDIPLVKLKRCLSGLDLCHSQSLSFFPFVSRGFSDFLIFFFGDVFWNLRSLVPKGKSFLLLALLLIDHLLYLFLASAEPFFLVHELKWLRYSNIIFSLTCFGHQVLLCDQILFVGSF
jgi:hypothetical protein